MAATKPPLKIKVLYAIGQFGWSLASFGAANLINYFYIPPEEGGASIFPEYIFQGYIAGVLTIIGVLNFGGRIFDAVTDPLIAGWSDRSKSKFGKRRKFMAISLMPFALASFLIFFPPVEGPSVINSVWLGACLMAFYFFMTLYVVPYTALISELGHTPDERLDISTIISITWALGFALGQQVYVFQGMVEQFSDATTAFQLVMGTFAGISALCMAVPVFFVNEKKYCISYPSAEGSFQAIRSSFKNSNFRFFMCADLTYWLAVTFIQMGMVYYVTILLNSDKELTSLLMLAIFALSFIMYAPINMVAKRLGKKKVQSFAFLILLINFLVIALVGKLPLSPTIQLAIVGILASIPLASFGILPNAIIADIAEEDYETSSHYKPAVFYALRALMMKFGIASANLLFPSLLLLGKTTENDLGVRATAIVALLACAIGFGVFRRYRESAN